MKNLNKIDFRCDFDHFYSAIKFIAFVFLVISCLNSSAQSQLKNWYLHGKKIKFTTSPIGVDDLLTTPTDVGTSNGIYDYNGALVFYINNYTIYDKNGDPVTNGGIGTIYLRNVDDISVVPFLNNDKCAHNKYYVFYSYNTQSPDIYCGLKVKIIDVNPSNGLISVLETVDMTSYCKVVGGMASSIAISQIRNNKRYVYFLGANSSTGGAIKKVELTNSTSSFNGIIPSSTTIFSVGPTYNSELELSNDGRRLAWGETYSGHPRFNSINLNDDGTYDNNGATTFDITAVTSGSISFGIEFSPLDKDMIYVTTGGTGTDDGIYLKDLSSGSSASKISGTTNYGKSMLETAYNGLIYACSSSDIKGLNIDPTNGSYNTFTSTIAVTPQIIDIYSPNGYGLPDQIDGENYDNSIPAAPIVYDAVDPGFTSTTQTWNAGSPPFTLASAGIIRIKESLNFNSGANITIENMTLEFGPNALLNINPGATVTLKSCTLQRAGSCNIMWDGIRVSGSTSQGKLIIYSPDGDYGLIRDAHIAIGASNGNAVIDFTNVDKLYFTANERDLFLTSVDGNDMLIKNGYMSGNEPLKDQDYGSNFNWDDGVNRSTTSITVLNCVNVTDFDHMYLEYYQNGINIKNSDVGVLTNSIENIKQIGLFADAFGNSKSLTIDGSLFSHIALGNQIKNGYTATITHNTFEHITDRFAIDWTNNKGRTFTLGHETDDSKKNTFSYCNWAAVNLFNNVNATNTIILIGNNEFNNQAYARAINIEEFNISTPSYYGLKVVNNTADLGTGIRIRNVFGVNETFNGFSLNPTIQHLGSTINSKRYLIDQNTVNFSNQYNDYPFGIQCENSGYLNFTHNILTSNESSDWRNAGFNFRDSKSSLIASNESRAGAGIQVDGYMINSNYYCNSLLYCVNGIKILGNHFLRNTGGTHGIDGSGPKNDSRYNYIDHTQIFGSDMWIGTNDAGCQNNLWVFDDRGAPLVQYVNKPVCSDIVAGTAVHSYCPSLGTGGGGGGGGGDISDGDSTLPRSAYLASNITGPNVLGWQSQQTIENNYRISLLDSGSSNPDIVFACDIDDYIYRGKFDSAQIRIGQWSTPLDSIAIDFKILYTIVANCYSRDSIFSSSEVDSLQIIAAKNPCRQSPASYLARTILWNELQLEYVDSIEKPKFNIRGLAGLYCEDLLDDIEIYLQEEVTHNIVNYSVFTDSNGAFIFWGDSLLEVISEPNANYRLVALIPGNTKYTNYFSLDDLYSRSHYLGCSLDKRGNGSNFDTIAKNEVQKDDFNIYPNPTTKILKVSTTSNVNLDRVTISDLMGRIVINNTSTNSIDVSNIPTGIYFVEVFNEVGNSIGKKKLSILHE